MCIIDRNNISIRAYDHAKYFYLSSGKEDKSIYNKWVKWTLEIKKIIVSNFKFVPNPLGLMILKLKISCTM